MEKKIIMPEDVVLTEETKTLYKDSEGKYYLSEAGAREKLATHFKCKCGNGIREKYRIFCDSCEPAPVEHFKDWDLKTPVYCGRYDRYFFDLGELTDYMHDNELKPEDMSLYICEPNYLSQIDSEYWQDDLPEDRDLPKIIEEKLAELNEAIKEYGKPISWTPSKYKTKYVPIETNA